MEVKHDKQADAVYVHLGTKPYAYGLDLDSERRIDYADDDTPIGVELLSVSDGVDVTGLPLSREIARSLEAEGILAYWLGETSVITAGVSNLLLEFAGVGAEEAILCDEESDLGKVVNVDLQWPRRSAPYRVEVLPEKVRV